MFLKLTDEETAALNALDEANDEACETFGSEAPSPDATAEELSEFSNRKFSNRMADLRLRQMAITTKPAYKTAKLKQMFNETAAHPALPILADAIRATLPLVVEGPVADLVHLYDNTMATARARRLMIEREALKKANFSESFAEEYLLRSAKPLTEINGAMTQAIVGHLQTLLGDFHSSADILRSAYDVQHGYGIPGSELDVGVAARWPGRAASPLNLDGSSRLS